MNGANYICFKHDFSSCDIWPLAWSKIGIRHQCDLVFSVFLAEPHVQNLLSIRNCIQDPSTAFVRGVLEPLSDLHQSGKICADMGLVLIDSLSEAEFHKPDYGDTIASFLIRHINKVCGLCALFSSEWIQLGVHVWRVINGEHRTKGLGVIQHTLK